MSLRVRRGGGAGAPPQETWGPSLGAQWVRDNARPQAVTQPTGTIITVDPGELNQTLLNNNPGATFWLTKGTHTITASLTPTTNQKFYLECPAGPGRSAANSAVLDAQNADLGGWIFGQNNHATTTGIEIHGGLFIRLGSAQTDQAQCYRAPICNFGETGWLVEDVEIGPTNQQGLRFSGDGFVARRCDIHDCGFYGVNTVVNDSSYRMTGGLMEYCHLESNSKVIHGTGNDAGQKFTHCDDSTFRYNWIENSEGAGLWWDYQHKNHHIHDNVIEGSWDWGLFYEWNYGGTEIDHNYLANNAEHYGEDSWFNAVQLLVSSTDATQGTPDFPEVRVHHNLLVGSSKQMGLAEVSGRPHPKGCKFYENDVWWSGTTLTAEIAGAESNDTQDVYNAANGNTFEADRYHVTNLSLARWQWAGASAAAGESKTWEQWQAYGHDVPDGLLEQV